MVKSGYLKVPVKSVQVKSKQDWSSQDRSSQDRSSQHGQVGTPQGGTSQVGKKCNFSFQSSFRTKVDVLDIRFRPELFSIHKNRLWKWSFTLALAKLVFLIFGVIFNLKR